MPEYTLRCRQCDHEFERFAWGDLEEGQLTCPQCGKGDVAVRWVIALFWENLANFGCA